MNLRNTLATSAAAIALTAAGTAQAEGTYLSVFGGLSTFDDELNLQTSTFNPGIVIPMHYVGTALLGKTALTTKITTPISTTWNVGFKTIVGARSQSTAIYHSSYFSIEDDFDSGFVVGAALGTSLSEGWRGELELAYRAADVSGGTTGSRRINGTIVQNIYFPSVTVGVNLYAVLNTASTSVTFFKGSSAINGPITSATKTTTIKVSTIPLGPTNGPTVYLPNASTTQVAVASGGDVAVWSLMANIWYDFDFMGLNPDGVQTFVGGGVGIADLDLEYNATAGTYFGGTLGYSIDDSAMGFAYQLGAGIGFELGDGMMLSAQYRWFGTSDIDVGGNDIRVESHNAIISLSVPLGNIIP